MSSTLSSLVMPGALIANGANSSTAPFLDTGFASTAFIILSSALVFLMVPGVGLLYSGLSGSKNALTIMMLSVLSYAVVSIQWVLFGYSLAFSETGSFFFGDFSMAGMKGVTSNAFLLTAPQIPGIAFVLFQLQFAAVTVAIIFGAANDRVRLLPALFFMFIWTTVIYDVTAYWSWASFGWLRNISCVSSNCGLGSLDFAGGGPVHMASGFSGLAYAIVLGKRSLLPASSKPHNIMNVFVGTGLLWFGWFGFNGASALGATPRAAMAAFVTTVAGSAGGLSWILFDISSNKKISGVGFCCGVLAGLVGITPASGFVAPWAAIVIGITTSICCNLACNFKHFLHFDDSLDAFALHGVGGFVGSILTGIFAQKWVAFLDGTIISGGAIEGYGIQIAYQLAGALAISSYSFFGTLIILLVMNLTPGLHLRLSPVEELMGGDLSELGETLYYPMPAEKEDFYHQKNIVIETAKTLA